LEPDDKTFTGFVIASVAKQSTGVPMDCFAALAMSIQHNVITL
jgi:hypothetical protein